MPTTLKSASRGKKRSRIRKASPGSVGGPESWAESAGLASGIKKVTKLPILDLVLDKQNPRIPESFKRKGPDDLLAYMGTEFQPLEVARSIAEHGYFPSEPLIVVQEDGQNIVVEGNRRLAALLLLRNPQTAKRLRLPGAEEWAELAARTTIPETVPAVIAQSRQAVAPIIGYRHISGIRPWRPREKARFVASFIDKNHHSFPETARLVGESERAVRELYRNYHILTQLDRDFHLNVEAIAKRFGVFTRAMQDERIRSFISAPGFQAVRRNVKPLPATAKPRALELITWIFGAKKIEPRIEDSRDLTKLGTILASAEGLKDFRAGASLDEAFELAGGVHPMLLARLNRAASSLEKALPLLVSHGDIDVHNAIDRCKAALGAILSRLSK
jgi:hypothetical protein